MAARLLTRQRRHDASGQSPTLPSTLQEISISAARGSCLSRNLIRERLRTFRHILLKLIEYVRHL